MNTKIMYAVIIRKHVTKTEMRYGQFHTLNEARNALQYLGSINQVDACFIEMIRVIQ